MAFLFQCSHGICVCSFFLRGGVDYDISVFVFFIVFPLSFCPNKASYLSVQSLSVSKEYCAMFWRKWRNLMSFRYSPHTAEIVIKPLKSYTRRDSLLWSIRVHGRLLYGQLFSSLRDPACWTYAVPGGGDQACFHLPRPPQVLRVLWPSD